MALNSVEQAMHLFFVAPALLTMPHFMRQIQKHQLENPPRQLISYSAHRTDIFKPLHPSF